MAKRKAAQRATVTFRVANEGRTMAKGKKGKSKKGSSGRRSNKRNPKRSHRRRSRRNPKMGFGTALGHALAGAAVMFGTGVLVTVATAKIAPGNPLSLYGIPAVTAVAGAAIATRAPMIGVGMAAGAAAPFVLPVGSKLLGSGTKVTQMNGTRARQLAAATQRAMRAVELGRVQMGVVEMGDEDDCDDADAYEG
jgi:hypothetical protein